MSNQNRYDRYPYKSRRRYSDRPRHQPRRRVWQAPEPARPCVVRRLSAEVLMDYNPEAKRLLVSPDYAFFKFPSKSKAQKAIWHTVQAEGIPMGHRDFLIEEL